MPAIADQQSLKHAIAAALTDGALPGELEGLDAAALAEAAQFVAGAVATRQPGMPAICLESVAGGIGAMRLVVNNDDMPFLVDSTAAVIAAHDVTARRLLHPVLAVERDGEGRLVALRPRDGGQGAPESIIYMELERADARARRAIVDDLHRVLGHVRLAVGDWEALRAQMAADAAAARDAETGALLRWLADGAFTLLGHQRQAPDGSVVEALGILRTGNLALWTLETARRAAELLRNDRRGVLLLKADVRSTVHRAAPLDLVVVPDGRDGGLSVHAGLWTSAALATPPADMPVLRQRLRGLTDKLRFDPRSHAGKALAHALTILPRDLLVALPENAVEELAITEVSLADRPRPAIVLAGDALGRHLFAFVWVPRDELNTQSRVMIADLLQRKTNAALLSWAVEAGEAETALIRYTLTRGDAAALPSGAELSRELDRLLRGWAPAVGEALVERVGAARAARLSLRTIELFPPVYRAATDPAQAADDVLRLAQLGPDDRVVRLFEANGRLHLKTYRRGGLIALSDAVPALENFGFRVLEEFPTALGQDGREGHIHDFVVEPLAGDDTTALLARAEDVEAAIAAVLAGRAENDLFNGLIVGANLLPFGVTMLRAWFRYLRQTGLSYGVQTVVDALRRAPEVARALLALFHALHDPGVEGDRDTAVAAARAVLDDALTGVSAIDDDRILRLLRSVVDACLRTNAFLCKDGEAFAFKLRSSDVPGLPAPVPWREVWVYSPRLEGIHLRGGPIARGGLRWSDRRDDFRTEILGLMKAQVVKNAVIVPTGAKGGFFPKQLPSMADRDAWLAEGTEAYRIFIRSLLSLTDNLAGGEVVHPANMVIRDEDDPYFVVAADKGTATFSDTANGLALERGFWLGDAFASGGSQGYDHKAMGITAKGAWISVQRHFAERGIDVQAQAISVAGVGDMSGDVFGNGMLLSRAILLKAAFDHRHIFLDPEPDAAASFAERERLFGLSRSSWADYDPALISAGGGVFPRTQKAIPLSPQVRALLRVEAETLSPPELISAILRAPVDLLWFGGIGTYVKGADENQVEVGDPANDAIRVDARALRAKAIGEGANLGVTMAGRIEFARNGGRINTDFIDNSAGVDCSDNEVNIKIPLNREMAEGRLAPADRDALLSEMTDEVAGLVLEDNRLQTLALSIAEVGGAGAVQGNVQLIGQLEASGHLNRAVEGLDTDEELLRRVSEGRGLTRPELAVLLSTTKLSLQDAIVAGRLPDDPLLEDDLLRAFPRPMREAHREAILQHRLRREIISTKVSNRLVNRLGLNAAFALSEEEGVGLHAVATGFVAAERLFDVAPLWAELDRRSLSESLRIELFREVARALRLHISDILRAMEPGEGAGMLVARFRPGLAKLVAAGESLLRDETLRQAAALRARLTGLGAPADVLEPVVRIVTMNGAIGIAALGHDRQVDEIAVTHAYTRLGEALGLDWAQGAASRYQPADPWERLLAAGLERDFEQLRLDFLDRLGVTGQDGTVERWLQDKSPRVAQFRALVERARAAPVTTAPMLAQIASQARVLLSR